jgi:hypothetical protein
VEFPTVEYSCDEEEKEKDNFSGEGGDIIPKIVAAPVSLEVCHIGIFICSSHTRGRIPEYPLYLIVESKKSLASSATFRNYI